MIFFLNLLIITGLLVFGYRMTRHSTIRAYYWPAVALKVAMGLFIGLFYKYYYQGGDTFSFFESAIVFKDIALESVVNFTDLFLKNAYQAYPDFQYSWIPSAFFVKLLAALAFLTGDNYWLSGIYLSLCSFSGLWLWTNVLIRLTGNKALSIISGLLFPSILFWSSGIMKESIAIPALAFLLTYFIKYYLGDRLKLWQFVSIVGLIIILAITKYFVAAILLTLIISGLLTRKLLSINGHWLYDFFTISGLLIFIGALISLLHPNLWPSRMAEVIYNNYQAYIASSDSNVVIVYQNLEPTIISVLVHLPKAIFSGLFLPLSPIHGSPVSIAAMIENWLLLLATLSMLVSIHLPKERASRILVWGALLFVLISAGLVALSTPNLGTLARYKTSYLIVYLPLIMSGIFNLYRKYLGKG